MKALVSSIVLAACVSSAAAQTIATTQKPTADSSIVTPLRFGISAGVSANTHAAGFVKLPGVPNCCPEFESGWGVGPYFGALWEAPLSERFRLDFRVGYTVHDAKLTREEPIAVEGAQGPIVSTIEHEIDGTLSSLGGEARARMLLSRAFSLSLGGRVAALMNAEFSQVERLSDAVREGTFENGRRTRNEASGEIPSASAVTVALLMGAGYDIPLDRNGYLRATPELTFGLALSSLNDSIDWYPHALHLGVTVSYDFARYERDTPVVVPEPLLTAEVRFEGAALDSAGTRAIHATEVIHVRNSPVVPAVYFDSASTEPPSRYRRLDASETRTYDETRGIEAFDFDVQHRDILNVLGSRLQKRATATLTLVPSMSNDETATIGQMRAESIRRYLAERWGIDPARIHIEKDGDPMRRANERFADGRSENRHVGLRSNDPIILAPVTSEVRQWRFDPERISIVPSITAEAGLKRAVIDVDFAGERLKRFEYGASDWASANRIDWTVAANELRLDQLPAELTARLSATDEKGKIVEATTDSSLTVVAAKKLNLGRFELSGRRRKVTYQLVAVPLGSPELDPINLATLKELVAQVRPGASITIRGYADRLGNPEYNQRLSQKRAELADNVLRSLLPASLRDSVTIDAQGLGVDTSRFDNDFPEGRVLTRGVSVVLEQDE